MPLIVGNLLTDPDANSFISIADADAFLAAGADAEWSAATEATKEAALVNASRWIAVSLNWCRRDLSETDLVRVGQAAARLAVQALTVDLWGGEVIGETAKRYKAGSVEVEYQDARTVRGAQAGGKSFPWLEKMLAGLLCSASTKWLARA